MNALDSLPARRKRERAIASTLTVICALIVVCLLVGGFVVVPHIFRDVPVFRDSEANANPLVAVHTARHYRPFLITSLFTSEGAGVLVAMMVYLWFMYFVCRTAWRCMTYAKRFSSHSVPHDSNEHQDFPLCYIWEHKGLFIRVSLANGAFGILAVILAVVCGVYGDEPDAVYALIFVALLLFIPVPFGIRDVYKQKTEKSP